MRRLLLVALTAAATLGPLGCGDGVTGGDVTDTDAADTVEVDGDVTDEFAALVASYDLLSTVAGRGEARVDGVNDWLPAYEGGPAVDAELSRPHVAMADGAGAIYIADKNAHAVRRVALDGTITTVAGTGEEGDDGDTAGPGTARRLSAPNGLWVREDGVVYILDLGNDKVRRLGADGELTTLVTDGEGIVDGRGLWVASDERLAYWSSGTRLRRWRAGVGVDTLAAGFVALGNLAVASDGALVVTDRGASRVYRVAEGVREVVAGNGTDSGGGHGARAVDTGLAGVRGVALLADGGMLLATHEGSQVWFVDSAGLIHLFLDGAPDAHAGDGLFFRTPGAKVAEVRAVTVTPSGDVLVTESDYGFVRRVRHR